MGETTYYKKKRNNINRAKDYYQNIKDVLREKAKKKYKDLSEEDKNIKREYGRNRYKYMSEEEKERLRKYQNKIIVNLIKTNSLNLKKST